MRRKQQTPIYKANGGYKCPDSLATKYSQTPFVVTSNVNGANPLYPNTGPLPNGFNFLNPITNQRGGDCGCSGGMIPMMGGRVVKHRIGCKCSMCRMNNMQMNGGGGCSTSNNGIPYPDGLVGQRYLNPTNLPGANGIPGDANFYTMYTPPANINYNTAVQPKSDKFTTFVEYPNHTLKQNRNYQVGFILADKFGRQSSVILSSIDLLAINIGGGIYAKGSTIYSSYDNLCNNCNIIIISKTKTRCQFN
jgi:hypothetical protein